MEFKMTRNGSGYYDETATKAFNGMAKSGEIWTAGNNGREREVIIIKNHGRMCNVLSLLDERKGNNCIEVVSRSLKYTDPRMIQYMFNDSLGQFVKALSDEEFDKVLDEVEDALEVNINRHIVNEEGAGMLKLYKESLEKANEKVKELETQLEEAKRAAASPGDSIYKQLYDNLIDKLIDKKVM